MWFITEVLRLPSDHKITGLLFEANDRILMDIEGPSLPLVERQFEPPRARLIYHATIGALKPERIVTARIDIL